jgi:hypothetical protein
MPSTSQKLRKTLISTVKNLLSFKTDVNDKQKKHESKNLLFVGILKKFFLLISL